MRTNSLQTGLWYIEGKERAKKEGELSRLLIDGRFSNQGNLPTRLVLGGRMCRSLYRPSRILKVYVKTFTGLNTTLLSPGYLETAPSVGLVDRSYIPQTGEGTRSLQLPGFSRRVNSGHVFLIISSYKIDDTSHNIIIFLDPSNELKI